MKIGLDRDEDTMKFNFVWMVVKVMVPLWIPMIIQHLILRIPQKGLRGSK